MGCQLSSVPDPVVIVMDEAAIPIMDRPGFYRELAARTNHHPVIIAEAETMKRPNLAIASLLAFSMFPAFGARKAPRERTMRNPDVQAAKIAAAKEKRLRKQRQRGGNV